MAEDRTSLEKMPYSNVNQALSNHHLHEALSSDGNAYGSNYERHEGLSLLRKWWRLICRHRLLIISVIVTVLPLVTIEAYRKRSVYQAITTIEVRSEGSSLKPNDIFYYDAYDNTKTEAFIVKCRPVIERTVVNLKLDRNPRFLDVTRKRSVWEAITALKHGGAEQEQKDEQAVAVETPGARSEPGDKGDKSEIADKGTLSAAERARLAPYIQALMNNLKVEDVRETRLLRLSFTHTDPEIAAIVSNGVAQNFIEYNFQNKTQHFTNASAWLEDSTRKLKARVEQAEQKLANYSREHDIFSLEGKENLTVDKLVRLHDQVMRAETDRLLKQSLYEEVKQGRVAQLPEAFADPKTAELRKTLNELAVTASQLSVKFGSKHPRLQEIREQMATYQDLITGNQAMLEERLKADYERAVREDGELKAALELAKNEAVQQNQAAIQYSVLKQDLETAKSLYTDFLNKTSQMDIQRAEQYNNVRLIEAAETPGEPIGPNRNQTIILAFILSLVLGIGCAYLIENLNTTIRTVEDVTRTTQLPLLGVIPMMTDVKHGILKAAVVKDLDDSFEQLNDYSDKPILADSMKIF